MYYCVRFISLACISIKTHNLQRIFRPPPPTPGGVVPYTGYIGMCHAKGCVLLPVLV